jgi:hypothetical protein
LIGGILAGRLRNPLLASAAKASVSLALVVRRRYKQNECVVPYPDGLSSSKPELSGGGNIERHRAVDVGKIDCLYIHPP